jgi:hypothetical protein
MMQTPFERRQPQQNKGFRVLADAGGFKQISSGPGISA